MLQSDDMSGMIPTYFAYVQDEKRTIYVDFRNEDKLLEIWKHIRQEADETIDNPPQIRKKAVDRSHLGETRYYNGVSFWTVP